MDWVQPNTIIGAPAEDDKYLARTLVEEAFWHALKNGEHVVFVAPRRVGKSSVMKALAKADRPDLLLVYQDIESCGTTSELYKRLWHLLLEHLNLRNQFAQHIREWRTRLSIKSVTLDGRVEFDDPREDHKALLLSLVKMLGDQRIQVVLMLDEFPEVISRIHKQESQQAAVDILHTLRELRHSEAFKHFTLVLAGSIGLHHVVSKLDRPKLINDLHTIDVPALTRDEGLELLELILHNATMQVPPAERTYLLDTVALLLPYHIQLLIADLNNIVRRSGSTEATTAMIDEAVHAVIARNDKFADWESRLVDHLSAEDRAYCEAVLTCCAHVEHYTIQQAHDLSQKVVPISSYKALIDDVLERDGYLLQTGHHLAFHSPFLKRWWAKRHPAHEIPSGL